MPDIIEKVQEANPDRSMKTLDRRILKLQEEAGECAQAYLSISSLLNSKNKTWNDVRTEAIDVIVIALDVALTRFPVDKGEDLAGIRKKVLQVFNRKVKRWVKKKTIAKGGK